MVIVTVVPRRCWTNGATLDDVQRAAGHSEASAAKLKSEKSARFFATY
jgi:hypothetical protein